jgi:SpoVK/Ycf46/Vps4 family AAA+-type ATPase
MLNGTLLETDFSLDMLADRTAGMSGSDLKELCRNAAMVPVREFLKDAGGDHEVLERSREEVCRLISVDFGDGMIMLTSFMVCIGFLIPPAHTWT